MSEDCPHCVYEKNEANCLGCFEGSHYRPKPVTNADRLRAMTDEELAEWECDRACYLCPIEDCEGRMEVGRVKCHKKWLDWLRKECE